MYESISTLEVLVSVFQLFYVSNASSTFKESDINKIIATAQEKNKESQLTGVLMFRAGTFLQLLEGDKAEVLNLYQKLHFDSRHTNLLSIFERETDKRLFQDWSMGYCEVGPVEIGMINEIFSWKRLVAGEKISDGKIHDFLNIFKTKQLKKRS